MLCFVRCLEINFVIRMISKKIVKKEILRVVFFRDGEFFYVLGNFLFDLSNLVFKMIEEMILVLMNK